jgi:cbb3-type cytochrome oxidase subunit 1
VGTNLIHIKDFYGPEKITLLLSSMRKFQESILSSSLNYNYKVVRQFAIATVVWGVIGMLAGVFIAVQLPWPVLDVDIPRLSYGRLRPLHTWASLAKTR